MGYLKNQLADCMKKIEEIEKVLYTLDGEEWQEMNRKYTDLWEVVGSLEKQIKESTQ